MKSPESDVFVHRTRHISFCHDEAMMMTSSIKTPPSLLVKYWAGSTSNKANSESTMHRSPVSRCNIKREGHPKRNIDEQ